MKRLYRRPPTLEILEELDQLSERVFQENNEQYFEDSTEVIQRMREERTEYLMQLHSQHSVDKEIPPQSPSE